MTAGSLPDGTSPHGAIDMACNVGEWVADRYDATYCTIAPSFIPPGPKDGSKRVVRRGSYIDDGVDLRTSVRRSNVPGFPCSNVRFRCAKGGP